MSDNHIKRPEILAPAGSFEILKAAINAGADAIYAGGNMYGARAFANNFDRKTMLEAIDYCHIHDKKLYMTVNTILLNEEIDTLYEYLKEFYAEGLDAVIVQDVGVMRYLHRVFPKMDIHASTQMSIVSGRCDNYLKSNGVTRIVPARELSIKEISRMRDESDMELEVFVHGALCYCYSGQCLFSSLAGGRSGNRGKCAQPCRQAYKLDNNKIGYFLSPKENCAVPYIGQLIEAGVDSFKIEGRMKKPEYVAYITSMYKKYSEIYMTLGSEKYERYIADNYDKIRQDIENMAELYNRNGFTDTYLAGNKEQFFYSSNNDVNGIFSDDKSDSVKMLSEKRPKHGGMCVGVVTSVDDRANRVKYKTLRDIGSHDVVEFRDKNQNELYEYTLKDGVCKNIEIEAKILAGSGVKKGCLVYRTRKTDLIDDIREKYIDKDIKIDVQVYFSAHKGEKCKLIIDDITWMSDFEVQQAQKLPIDKEKIKNAIMQTGNTCVNITGIKADIDDDAFVPVSTLKNLRRMAIEEYLEIKCNKYRRTGLDDSESECNDNNCESDAMSVNNNQNQGLPECHMTYAAQVADYEQFRAVNEAGSISEIFIRIDAIDKSKISDMIKECKENGKKAYISCPRILREKHIDYLEKQFKDLILNDDISGYLVKNMESIYLLHERFAIEYSKIILDNSLYIINKEAENYWKDMGITTFTCPYEMSLDEIRRIKFDKKSKVYEVVYAQIPVMVSAMCIDRNTDKCTQNNGLHKLAPVKDTDNIVYNEVSYCRFCYNEIYRTPAFSVNESVDKLFEAGVCAYRFDFSTETYEETRNVLKQKNKGIGFKGHFYDKNNIW